MSTASQERLNGIHPAWGLAVLAATGWQCVHTFRSVGPDGLFALCYLTNFILAAGVLCRSGLLTGIGFGWTLIAFPLWLVDALVTHTATASCVALHATGLCVGTYALRHTLMPRWIVLAALPIGLLSCGMARLCTAPQLNINAVFSVQQGWNWLFPNHLVSFLAQNVVYSLVFWYLPVLNSRLAAPRKPS